MKDPHLETVAIAKKLIEIRNDTIQEKVRAIGCRRKFEHKMAHCKEKGNESYNSCSLSFRTEKVVERKALLKG
jgi:hypothetical protein